MINAALLLTAIYCSLSILLGVAVLLKNPVSTRNRIFLVTCISSVVWTGSIALFRNESGDTALFFSRLMFVGSALSVISLFYLFNSIITNDFYTKYKRPINACSAILLLSTLNPWLVTDVYYKDGGQIAFHNGVAAPIFYLSITIILIFVTKLILGVKYKREQHRSLRNYLLAKYSFLITGIVVSITNYILPLIFNNHEFSIIGSMVIFAFMTILAYLVTSGLFRIRFAVIITAALKFLHLSVFIIFLTIASLLITIFFRLDVFPRDWENATIATVAIALLTVLFIRISKIIRRYIKRTMQDDYYDMDEIVSSANRIVIGALSEATLANQLGKLLKDTFQAQFCEIVLFERNRDQIRYFGNNRRAMSKPEIVGMLDASHLDLIDLSFIPLNDTSNVIELAKRNVEIIKRIKYSNHDDGRISYEYGLVLLGNKKSGVGYSKRDLILLSTIADQLEIGLDRIWQIEEINNFNHQLKTKVRESTNKLRTANRHLHELDRAKDDFVVMASHQLRTPLTSIRGYISMIVDGDFGEITNEQRRILDDVYSNCTQITYLIGDLLDMSRIQTGKWAIHKTPVQLAQIVSSEIDQISVTAQGRNISLDFTTGENLPAIQLDENKIRQVVMNLIDNAIYYSHNGGKVEVNLHQEEDDIIFTVRDYGIGVSNSDKENLFKKFFRGSNARTVRPDGTGIGLYMAQKVVTGHNGRVIFDSKEGEGSTFGFRIPISKNDN